MKRIIESVPNFSEGIREDVIRDIVDPIKDIPDVRILDLSSDKDHNRSVLTMAGNEGGLSKAVDLLFSQAIKHIDLTKHKGEHPRMGAIDVLPFIPIRNVTMEECVEFSKKIGQQIASKFGIPVYLYEKSATLPERENLANIRKGQFEGFFEKIRLPEWKPDFGFAEVHPTAGVVAVGAREFLIAFNINLGTDNIETASKISKAIRHSSGGLRFVKAMGVMLEERKVAQVSINLTDFRKTSIFRVFEMVRQEASRYGVNVIGSEIVGLIPNDALLDVAEYYLRIENFSYSTVLENRLAEVE
ncbi:MAG: glutamate formimidoyltransferase [Acidobacteriota bacterium]